MSPRSKRLYTLPVDVAGNLSSYQPVHGSRGVLPGAGFLIVSIASLPVPFVPSGWSTLLLYLFFTLMIFFCSG